jgi:hypothetical protein
MANSKLKPFRDYDEHDVINLFRWSGTVPAYRGTIVTIQTGWMESDELQMLGSVGASYVDVQSQRYGVQAMVRGALTGDARPLGMLLHDVKETDENGEKLIYNPRKVAEMEVALSGQAVPVVTKGMFLVSGDTISTQSPAANQALYVDANGQLTTGFAGTDQKVVGKALGTLDATSKSVLVKLEL